MQLPISALAQDAVRRALAKARNQGWIERARSRARRPTIDTSQLLDEVRQDFGA